MKTSSQDILITKNGLYTNDNQQENDITSVTAGTADNNIKNINDPNYLSPFEKPQLEIQMDNFATNYAADKDIATSEGIDFTAYDAAYQAYLAYMTPLIADMTTYSPIVRATFNSMVTAVQAEQKRFNAATQAQYNQQIKQAQTDISDGQTKYKALQSDAETMKSSVAGIADEASKAISNAGFASNAASTASQAASSALASAMSAQSDANAAVSKAELTASAFGKVGQKADSAVASALSAQSNASDAVNQASSAAADSKDAKQIAGAVSQSYKTLTDGSTMTIAELEGGLAVKLTKKDLDGYATETWAQNQIKMTADGINGTISSVKSTVDGQTTSINDLKADSSGFKAQFETVNGTLGKHTTDIGSLQASSKELTSGFNTLTTDNKTNKNDISQLKQTATKVSSTLETVKTQVQDSSVGTNLLTGTSSGLKTKQINNAWKVVPQTTNGDFKIKVVKGQTYTYRAWLDNTNGPDAAFVNIRLLPTTEGAHDYSAGSGTHINKGETGYSTLVFTPPEDGYIQLTPFAYNLEATTLAGWKEEKFEKGSLATDWCANPADNATVTAVSKFSQTVDSMQTDISKKIEQKDLNGYATETWTNGQIKLTADGINGTISSIKGTVDGQTTSINDLKADSRGFKDQFTTVTNTLGTQTTDISTLQASSEELTTGFNTLTTDNKTNKNDISQLKQTSTEVSSTLETVQTQVQNSSVGTNLLLKTYEAFSMTGNNTVNQAQRMYALSRKIESGTTVTLSFDAVSTAPASFNIRSDGGDGGTWMSFIDRDTVDTTKKHYVTTITLNGFSDLGIKMRLDNVPSTVTIKVTNMKLELGSNATDYSTNPLDNATVTAVSKLSQTADSVQVLATNNQGDIASLQITAKGLQSTVSDKVSSDQLTQLSNQLTNKISDLSSSTSSQFTQTASDINGLVKKGDVVNQFNLDAGGALLSTSGNSTKIVFSSPNIIFDSANPVQIPNANIPGTLTGKTIEAGTITATTKITGADIEAPLIHSPSGSFKLDGNTGDIIGASIHSADNSWGIDKNGNINGATINTPNLKLGDNGQLTGSYSVNDDPGWFQPINGTGSLHIDHGYIQSTANVSYFNKILNGIGGDKWGHWESSTQFVPAPDQAHPDTSNVAESTLTPAFLKLDIFNADKSSVKSRAYMDGTGLYINDGQAQSIVSMLSDYELISNGMAYLNSGIEMKKSASFTFGNLILNGYHTIAMHDGKAINFTSASAGGSPIEVKAKTFTKLSRLSIKHDITPLSTAESSRLLNAIDVEKFRYTHDGATYKYQYGGVIDDVNSLGSKQYSMPPELLSEDGTGINLDSLTGILIKRVQDQDKMIGKLSMRLTKLEMEK